MDFALTGLVDNYPIKIMGRAPHANDTALSGQLEGNIYCVHKPRRLLKSFCYIPSITGYSVSPVNP